MKAMSYNILTGGRDGLEAGRIERVLEVIARECPDVLALQECNQFDADSHAVFHYFERRLGMRGLLACAASGFHVAAFFRQADVVESSTISGWCQHAMMRTRVLWRGNSLDFTSVHHNPFSGTARLTEAEYLAGRSHPEEFQLVMGDFNANSPVDGGRFDVALLPARYRARQMRRESEPPALDTRSIAAMLEAEYVDVFVAHARDWIATVPSRLVSEQDRYGMRIDFAFASVRLAAKVRGCRVVRDELTDTASDHYPIIVEFDDDWA